MTPVVVVPFLLGTIFNFTLNEDTHFEYTFQVNVNSKFFNLASKRKLYARLSLDLKCHNLPVDNNSMMCHVGKYNVMQPVPEELPKIRQFDHVNRTLLINQTAFHNESEPFQVKFSPKGIDGYVVERNAIPTNMMNVYRMIANLLSVGAAIEEKNREFVEMERSDIGLCPTRYIINQEEPKFNPDVNFTSFFGAKLEEYTIIVLKQRNIAQCRSLSNFSFSARLWPELAPIMSISYHLTESHGAITMSSRGLESLTENVFTLYNKREKQVADITEIITLQLISYQMLHPNRVITLDKKKAVLLDVINND